MPRASYREGDWFAVPLRDGGFGVGIVGRANRDGVLLGYFFGPKRSQPPPMDEVASLKPDDAILVAIFDHLGLRQGSWPLLGRLDSWSRDEWPMPAFSRFEELSGRSYQVTYADDDPNQVVREEPVPRDVAARLPPNDLLGAGAVEKRITNLLR